MRVANLTKPTNKKVIIQRVADRKMNLTGIKRVRIIIFMAGQIQQKLNSCKVITIIL